MLDSGELLLVFLGVIFAVPRYGFTFFPGNHLGPEGRDTHVYPRLIEKVQKLGVFLGLSPTLVVFL